DGGLAGLRRLDDLPTRGLPRPNAPCFDRLRGAERAGADLLPQRGVGPAPGDRARDDDVPRRPRRAAARLYPDRCPLREVSGGRRRTRRETYTRGGAAPRRGWSLLPRAGVARRALG